MPLSCLEPKTRHNQLKLTDRPSFVWLTLSLKSCQLNAGLLVTWFHIVDLLFLELSEILGNIHEKLAA